MDGITWIGLLYYFKFVQLPFFATALGVQARSAVTRGLMPTALGCDLRVPVGLDAPVR
jgi:uncharacterized membrane protein